MEEEIAQRLSAEAPGKALEEMVELAKTRGGHDNITGVTVHILDVVDAVPESVSADSTAPVEALGPNPFADEPTETSVLAPLGMPPRVTHVTPNTLRATQPMRAFPDDPVVEPKEIKPDVDEVPTDKSAALKPDGAKSEKSEAKSDKKKKKKAKKSDDETPPPDDEAPTETTAPKEK